MDETIPTIERLRGSRVSDRAPMGLFVGSTDPTNSEMAAAAGFDFLLLDGEHCPLDRLTMLDHVRAGHAAGCVVLARGQDSSSRTIQSILDIGCDGVVLPRISDASEVEAAVRASLYAPEGTRGVSVGCPDGAYAVRHGSTHVKQRNRTVMTIPQIETLAAVANIDEIAAIRGADLFFFGPGDLSAEMGVDLQTGFDKIREPWSRVRDTVHAAGKSIFTVMTALEGADAYVLSMDLILLRQALDSVLENFRDSS